MQRWQSSDVSKFQCTGFLLACAASLVLEHIVNATATGDRPTFYLCFFFFYLFFFNLLCGLVDCGIRALKFPCGKERPLQVQCPIPVGTWMRSN